MTWSWEQMHAELDAEVVERGPAEWAFAELLKVAAFGLAHREHRDPLRERTLMARRMFREAQGTCLGCGHERHDPPEGEFYRACGLCRGGHGVRSCGAFREEDGQVRYS